jgi:hypothetical protein
VHGGTAAKWIRSDAEAGRQIRAVDRLARRNGGILPLRLIGVPPVQEQGVILGIVVARPGGRGIGPCRCACEGRRGKAQTCRENGAQSADDEGHGSPPEEARARRFNRIRHHHPRPALEQGQCRPRNATVLKSLGFRPAQDNRDAHPEGLAGHC